MATTIFEVPARIAADVEGHTFPPHPITDRAPGINPSDYDEADESIIVVSRTFDDDSVVSWQAMGAGGRHERYIVDVIVTTRVHGRTWAQMMERLGDLTLAVLAMYTDDHGQFVPPGGVDDGVNEYGIFTGMANAERSNQWGTDEGWAGQCRVAIRIAAQI